MILSLGGLNIGSRGQIKLPQILLTEYHFTSMSTEDKQNEDSKETVTEETPATPTNDAPIEPTKHANETPIEAPSEQTQSNLNEILKELQEMRKSYEENISSLQTELKATKKELSQFKEETESNKPVRITATVKGKYDFTKKVAQMGHKNIKDYEAHCREVYDRINNAYPTINKLT